MRKGFKIITFIFLATTHATMGQFLLNGIVVDVENGEPLPGANVFIQNTSMGTTTDKNGAFLLGNIPYTEFDLVVTFVGYSNYANRISLDELSELQIELSPATTVLTEIAIKSSIDKVWKRNFKKFTGAFLGSSKNARKCDITNPWVLEFTKDQGSIKASASEPLIIRNNALGYIVTYALESFEMSNSSISFGGKATFRELDTTDAKVKSNWIEGRNEVFFGSKNHFLKALSANQLENEGFDIYEARLSNNQFTTTKKINAAQIINVGKDGSNYVKFNQFLKVVYNKKKAPVAYVNDPIFSLQNNTSQSLDEVRSNFSRDHETSRGASGNAETLPISILTLQSSQLKIDESGFVIDNLRIGEYGYWAWLRVGDMLPANYTPIDFKIARKPFGNQNKDEQHPQKNGFRLNNLLILIEEILSGGVRKDGIPSIDTPKYSNAENANFMKDRDLVLTIDYKGQVYGYPIKILNYHEIVNEKEFVVTYCPLCLSGIIFDNLIEHERLQFGVSGLLYNSDVLMYDRGSASLWSQLEQAAISGLYSGKSLKILPSSIMKWEAWKSTYPEGKVLSPETGYTRDYDYNPYAAYDRNASNMFPVNKESPALNKKVKVVGITVDDIDKAYPLAVIKRKRKINDVIAGKQIKVTFDHESESISVTSNAQEIPHTILYWFAWYTFHPNTKVFD